MKVEPFRGKKRRGAAAIVGAVLLFAMLFTVGTGYFLFMNTGQKLSDQALNNRNSAQQNQMRETLQIATLKLSDGNIGLYANNTGGIGVNITGLYLQYTGERVVTCMGVGLPNGCLLPTSTPSYPGCQFPVYINIGKGTNGIWAKLVAACSTITKGTTIDTNYPANSTVAVIRLITQRGNIFSTTYPLTATELAAKAISSGAIGDLYLNFHSYTYYAVTTSECPSSGTQLGLTSNFSSGECLTTPMSAFLVPYTDSSPIAFSVAVTDLNNQSLSIVLDQFSLLYQVLQGPNSKGTYYAWYITSVETYNGQQVVLQKFNPYVLSYDRPVTLYFMATQCITGYAGPTASTCTQMSSTKVATSACIQLGNACTSAGGYVSTVFIISHGWEQAPPVTVSLLQYSQVNYGQNSPYVTSLYN